ncbi:MAG: cation transporter [Pseudomonadota bacterium]
MSASCASNCSSDKLPADPKYRRILWIALIVNASMFGVEVVGGWTSGSAALLADAVDFLGDAANYAVSLFVLTMAAIWRSRTAMVKGAFMGLYGLFVLATAAWHFLHGTLPKAEAMSFIALLALTANVFVAFLLYAYRNGDSNMRAVWLCTRNDAIGNIAVLAAAAGVATTGAGWPDIAVAVVMGVLAMTGSRSVLSQARGELRAGKDVNRRH